MKSCYYYVFMPSLLLILKLVDYCATLHFKINVVKSSCKKSAKAGNYVL